MDELGQLEVKRPPIQNVLLVEENQDCVARVKEALAPHNVKVTVAKDGGQAHGCLEMQRIDYVITELIVRGESGFELCEWIKNKSKQIPVLILTEVNLESARGLAARVGADGYVTKPFQNEVLWEMIEDTAQLVWERNLPENQSDSKDQLRIKFKCTCGKVFTKRSQDSGRSIQCPDCNQRVKIPLISEIDRPDFRTSEKSTEKPDVSSTTLTQTDPVQHVMIQCTECGTSFHLFSNSGERMKECPKCGHEQTGNVTMTKSLLSTAALKSCGRVFLIKSGKGEGKKMLLPPKKIHIGRIRPSDVLVQDPSVSRIHCYIKPTERGLVVRDLGSRTGTFVNDKQITEPVVLLPGDVLKVGPFSIQLLGEKMESLEEEVESDVVVRDDIPTATLAAAIIRHHWNVLKLQKSPHAKRTGTP